MKVWSTTISTLTLIFLSLLRNLTDNHIEFTFSNVLITWILPGQWVDPDLICWNREEDLVFFKRVVFLGKRNSSSISCRAQTFLFAMVVE